MGSDVCLELSHAVLAARPPGQDRVAVIPAGSGFVLALADGSGGLRGGAEAAERSLQLIADDVRAGGGRREPAEWSSLLAKADTALAPRGGQCAIVVAAIAGTRITGASAGDCGAYLIHHEMTDLTAKQVRKPLLGTGSAVPVPFEAQLGAATLLLASDGLHKYAAGERIAAVAREDDLHAAAARLCELPRLRSGALPDDIAVVLCRASLP